MTTDTDFTGTTQPDELVLVDESGRVTGYAGRAACHEGDGLLHLAFSVFIFDSGGRLLLQQRSASKALWGEFWSNSCCSHPRRGEGVMEAAHRRLEEELGLDAELEHLFVFTYHARFGEVGSERELCHVMVGRYEGPVTPNPEEIAAVRWIEPEELDREIERTPERFTPWFLLEWPRVKDILGLGAESGKDEER